MTLKLDELQISSFVTKVGGDIYGGNTEPPPEDSNTGEWCTHCQKCTVGGIDIQ